MSLTPTLLLASQLPADVDVSAAGREQKSLTAASAILLFGCFSVVCFTLLPLLCGCNRRICCNAGVRDYEPFEDPRVISTLYRATVATIPAALMATTLLSIGASISVVQYRLEADKLLLNNPGDPRLYTSNGYKIYPDASFGIYYKYKNNFYTGISVPQLMGLNINYRGNDGTAMIKKVQHLNILIGGKIEFARGNFSIDPIASFHWTKNAPPHGDVGVRFNMYKAFFIGANYRSLNYAVFEGGFAVKDLFFLSYAYDFNFSKYRKDLGSTHEVTLSFKINKTGRVWRGVGPALRF
jgi:hypothetical protein